MLLRIWNLAFPGVPFTYCINIPHNTKRMPWQRPPNTNIQSHASKNGPKAKFTAGTCGTLKPRLRQLSQANHTPKSASVPPKKAKLMMSVQIPYRIKKGPKSPPWKAQCLHNPENSLKKRNAVDLKAINICLWQYSKREIFNIWAFTRKEPQHPIITEVSVR